MCLRELFVYSLDRKSWGINSSTNGLPSLATSLSPPGQSQAYAAKQCAVGWPCHIMLIVRLGPHSAPYVHVPIRFRMSMCTLCRTIFCLQWTLYTRFPGCSHLQSLQYACTEGLRLGSLWWCSQHQEWVDVKQELLVRHCLVRHCPHLMLCIPLDSPLKLVSIQAIFYFLELHIYLPLELFPRKQQSIYFKGAVLKC